MQWLRDELRLIRCSAEAVVTTPDTAAGSLSGRMTRFGGPDQQKSTGFGRFVAGAMTDGSMQRSLRSILPIAQSGQIGRGLTPSPMPAA